MSNDGNTISAVTTKKRSHEPSQSTVKPLNPAKVVRLKFPNDANKAYCVALNALPVRAVKNDTKATVENAVVKLSTMRVKIGRAHV